MLVLGSVAAGQQAQQPTQQNVHLQGQVLRVDPQTSTMVVRGMDGNKAVERQYKVETGTQYWGADRKPFFDGLTNKNFKQGTDVWYQLGTGDKQGTITHLRMYDPAPPKNPDAPSDESGAGRTDPGGAVLKRR
jgi:hypothetical protein